MCRAANATLLRFAHNSDKKCNNSTTSANDAVVRITTWGNSDPQNSNLMSDLEKTAFYGDLVGVKIGVECRYFGIELLRDRSIFFIQKHQRASF